MTQLKYVDDPQYGLPMCPESVPAIVPSINEERCCDTCDRYSFKVCYSDDEEPTAGKCFRHYPGHVDWTRSDYVCPLWEAIRITE
jgi:hypothetical protein